MSSLSIRRSGVACFLLLVGSAQAHAAYHPGEPDPTFGGPERCDDASPTGQCILSFQTLDSDQHDEGHTILRTADGGYLVVGAADDLPNGVTDYRLAVTKLQRDGSLDAAFGTSGLGRAILNVGFSQVLHAALDAQGRILVAWHVFITPDAGDIGVARLLPNGALDTSFGGDGSVVVSCSAGTDQVVDIASAPSGEVLLAASTGLDAGTITGGCLLTLADSGSPAPLGTRLLPNTADTRNFIASISVDTDTPTYVSATQCIGVGCSAAPTVSVRDWYAPIAATPIFGPIAIAPPAGSACTTNRDARPIGPMAVFDDATTDGLTLFVRAGYSSMDDYDDAFFLLARPPGGGPAQLSCLAEEGLLRNANRPRSIQPTGHGADVYVLGQYELPYLEPAGTRTGVSVRRYAAGSTGLYTRDATFDTGIPRDFSVASDTGTGDTTNYLGSGQHHALLDPGIPGDVPPLPQLVFVSLRKGSDDSFRNWDFVVTRLGGDPTIFAGDFE